MAIEGPKINIADKLAGRALVGQPRRLDCRIERRPHLACGPAVPDGHKLFSLDGIAAKLALAAFLFGPLGCGPLARHPALVEAHGPEIPWAPSL